MLGARKNRYFTKLEISNMLIRNYGLGVRSWYPKRRSRGNIGLAAVAQYWLAPGDSELVTTIRRINLMIKIVKIAALVAMASVSVTASAWWGGGPWGGGPGYGNGNGNWMDDWMGDGYGDFNMNMSGGGHGRGYNRYNNAYGYGYGPYGWGGPYGGYGGYGAPYGGGYGAPYGVPYAAPVVPVAPQAAPASK